MSAVDTADPVRDRFSMRLWRSELRLIATRRRNLIAASVLCAIPLLLTGVLAMTGAADATGTAPPLVSMMYGNGLLVVTAMFSVACLVFLPLAAAMLAADAISAEAGAGTLRYLLAVPIGRTRLLLVKFAAAATAVVAMVVGMATTGAGTGLAVFGTGELVTLSGSSLEFGESVRRVGLVCLYVIAMQVGFVAVAMFASTLTDQPAGVVVGCMLYVLCDQLLVSVPQLDWLDPFLLTGYWRDWGDLLRVPMSTDHVVTGLVVAAVYAAVGLSAAWARFTTREITC